MSRNEVETMLRPTRRVGRQFGVGSSTQGFLANVHYQAEINDRNVIGVASFLNESARYSDLALFEEKLAPGALGQNMTVFSINGAPNDQSPGSSTEANLDIQHVIDMANGVHVTEFITGLA
ncbi:uncharacterized protein EAE98_004981 [Botrytis deweyae]|uniref:Uncharacterized protein n=1 Tax=Botrytis deweyae TaxID=2478750 RepID=A0ABQ7IPW5_9HELO|nr:uncharacterized protein EAE98_004981 [Botrytis deweyae]KAF7930581.1 hypothetical protein EAE98_004981 [Botrytis deweyae]